MPLTRFDVMFGFFFREFVRVLEASRTIARDKRDLALSLAFETLHVPVHLLDVV